MSGLNMRHHHRGNVHCEIKGCILLHTVWGKRVLDNEITAAFHPPISLSCKAWCNTKVHLKQHTHKEQPTELPPAFQTGILSTWQTSESPNPTLGYRERASVTTTPLSFSFFPSSIDIRGVERLYVQLLDGWWGQRKTSSAWRRGNWRRLSPRWIKNSFR